MPQWREEIHHIERFYMKPENLQLLKSTEDWLETAFCTIITIYQMKMKQLLDAFGDLYTSDVLNVHRFKSSSENSVKNKNNKSSSSTSMTIDAGSSISSVGSTIISS
jgi:hypothetical protein